LAWFNYLNVKQLHLALQASPMTGTIKNNVEQKSALYINFLPGSKMFLSLILAGFLACPGLKYLPIRQLPDSGKRIFQSFAGLTAAGTAPVLHRIPFYYS
jgi:hypothetical protein